MKGCVFMSTKIIDISKWNSGKLNWKKISTTVDGVIIRIGYRGFKDPGHIKIDPKFKEYANICTEYKIPFGVYWFAQEITEKESIESARYIHDLLKGYKLSYPVYYDVEWSGEPFHSGRADVICKSVRTACTIAFCEEIKNLGLVPGVYATPYWFKNMLSFNQIKDYSIWCAKWDNDDGKPGIPPSIKYDLWQYTSKGSIDGITGFIDISLDKSALIIDKHHTILKNIDDIAIDVINGKYGDGIERKNNLIAAGYDYNEVQMKVNELLNHKTFKVGDIVKLKSDAVYTNGIKIPNWVKERKLYIRDDVRDNGDVIISIEKYGEITGVVNTEHLIKL